MTRFTVAPVHPDYRATEAEFLAAKAREDHALLRYDIAVEDFGEESDVAKRELANLTARTRQLQIVAVGYARTVRESVGNG